MSNDSRRSPGRLARAGAALLLVSAASLAFHEALRAPFLHDDAQAIERNDTIAPPLELGRVFSPPHDTTVAGRPVLNLSFALDRARAGLDPQGFHFTNLAIHLLATLLLMGVALRTLASERLPERVRRDAAPLALGIALLWSLHPLTTQAVVYVAQRAESLVSLLVLATLYASIRAAEARRPWIWGAVAAAFCAMGMGTKEVMVAAPLIVLAHDLVFLDGSVRSIARRRWPLWLVLGATWGIVVGLVATTPRGESVGTSHGVSPLAYLGTQVGVLAHYLRLAVWPRPLVFDYEWPIVDSVKEAIVPGISVVLLGLATLWGLARRHPLGFLGAVFFLVLGPSSSVVPIVTEVAAEHRMYLPLAAVVALVVVVAHAAVTRTGLAVLWRTRLGPALLTGLALTLGVSTARRVRVYGDAMALWSDVLAHQPDNWRAHLSMGVYLLRERRLEEARAACEEALRLGHDGFQTQANLGLVLLRLGLFAEAAKHLRRAVALEPSVGLHDQLAEALANSGSLPEAVEHLRSAAALDPGKAQRHAKLARGLLMVRRPAEALVELRNAVSLNEDTPVRLDLAWLLATHPDDTLRDGAEALLHAEALVASGNEPRDEHLHALGAAQAELGRFDDAAESAERAIVLAAERDRADLVDELRSALGEYRAERPVRDERRRVRR